MANKSILDIGKHGGGNDVINAAKGVIPEEAVNNLSNPINQENGGIPVKEKSPVKVVTAFGTQLIGGDGGGGAVVELKTIDDVVSAISKEVGLDLKDFNEVITKVVEPYKSLKGEMVKVPELESRVSTLSEAIQGMPDDLAKVFHAYYTNGDYQAVMGSIALAKSMDFSKDFGQQDEVKMVNHYSGQNFTKEELGELTPNVRLSLLTNARRLYDIDKSQQTVKPDVSKKINERQQAFMDSVEASINNLKATYPDMAPDRINEVKATMMTKAGRRLFTPEGLYKLTAASDISMMLFGGEAIAVQNATIQEIMNATMEQGKTIATEQILLRNDKPNPQNRGGGAVPGQEISQKVKQSTSFLRGGGMGETF